MCGKTFLVPIVGRIPAFTKAHQDNPVLVNPGQLTNFVEGILNFLKP